MEEARYNEMIALNKLKEKNHNKLKKGCGKNNRRAQMLLKAWKENDGHPARCDYNRLDGITAKDRLEFRAIQELIKVYQTQVDKITKAK